MAFDTSVLVPALSEAHPFHARAINWLDAASSKKIAGVVAWHGLAETWSVLTRLPTHVPVSAATAERMVERVARRLTPLAMTAAVYRRALQRCADRGLRSGALFDALHLAAAEVAKADVFLTFNPGDFERLAAAPGPAILAPPDPPRVLTRAP